MKIKAVGFVLVCVVSMMLVGCVDDFEIRLSLCEDGSVDVEQYFLRDTDEGEQFGDIWSGIKEEAEKDGYETEKITREGQEGVKISRHYEHYEQLEEITVPGEEQFRGEIDIEMGGNLLKEEGLVEVFIDRQEEDDVDKNTNVELFLELPREPSFQNADKVDGKTVSWEIDLLEESEISAGYEHLDYTVIAVLAVLIVAILGGAAFFVIKSKGNNKEKESEEL